MPTAGPTNTPFGWGPFAVMSPEEARSAADLLKRHGVPVITRQADDGKSELLVPTASEQRARDLLEAAPAPEPGAVEPDAEEDTDGDGDAPEGDADEGRLEDLGDAFDAADRLKHQPWNEAAAAELDRALQRMSGTSAPYGIGGAFWDRALTMVADLQEMIRTGQREETVRSAAGALRDLLRPYI